MSRGDDLKKNALFRYFQGKEKTYCDYAAGVEMAEKLGEMTNSSTFNEQAFALGFLQFLRIEHRYLQNGIVWMLADILTGYGQTQHFDQRNEGAISMARKVYDLMYNNYGHYVAKRTEIYAKKMEQEEDKCRNLPVKRE